MAKQAPIVRLPPKPTAEIMLGRAAQVATVLVGIVAFVFALHAAEYILAPSFLGVVIGLMFGPLATRLEARGMPPALSALVMTLLFILCVGLFALAVAAPLSFWVERLPRIWSDLQAQLWQLKAPLDALKHMRDQLRELTGSNGVAVSVDEGVGVESMAALAPAIIGQVLIFLASLYFFIATRDQTRIAILKLCLNRRLRWRAAHIFRDVEQLVSRYLLSITVINVCEGLAVGIALLLIGIPSAPLWGAVAIVTNFVVFIGPIVMVAILFAVGLTQFDSLAGSLLPVAVYLGINMIESQFVTPMVIGRTMTLNPFVVVLALVFWIWLWGPLGGFVAIPALLIAYAVIRNIVPGFGWGAENTAR
jgi:predicted PurR-regulated permease PerM